MIHKEKLTKKFLEEHYFRLKKSSRKIANEIGCEKTIILDALKRYGLNARKNGYELSGKRFGFLTVISEVGRNHNDCVLWECKCDCGNSKVLKTHDLSRIKSCGCLRKRCRENSSKWRGHGEISRNYWRGLKDGASCRGLSFSILIEDGWDLFLNQDKSCALTGKSLEFSSTSRSRNGTASLDRICPQFGYEQFNIQWVHKDVNTMKLNYDNKHFVEIMISVAENNKQGFEQFAPNESGMIVKEKSHNFTGWGNIYGDKWYRIKREANKRKLDISFDIKDIWQLYLQQRGLCAITKIPIRFSNNYKLCNASLDRINSKCNYKLDNVQWVCKDINRMKNKYSQEYFIEIANAIKKSSCGKMTF